MKKKNTIQSYNRIFYGSGPITVSQYLKNDLNEIHEKLYRNALNNFLHDKNYPERLDWIDNPQIHIIEIKQSEYWLASDIHVIDYSKYPRKVKKYALDDYWDNIFVTRSLSEIDNIESSPYQEIDYLDYVNGKAVILDRLENKRYRVDFKDLSGDLELSEDYDAFSKTFQSERY
ncbi:MAG: hypothetical protein J1F35_03475 [Erysipelotrichales bacterium]|nr:hypothetical protein [Erysipelotrichales bacterium]